jgi:hypothetical protein
LKDLVGAIAKRHAPTHFCWVKGHSKNQYNDAVDLLENEDVKEPHTTTYSCPPCRSHPLPPSPPLINIYKVFTSLPPISVPSSKAAPVFPTIESEI